MPTSEYFWQVVAYEEPCPPRLLRNCKRLQQKLFVIGQDARAASCMPDDRVSDLLLDLYLFSIAYCRWTVAQPAVGSRREPAMLDKTL